VTRSCKYCGVSIEQRHPLATTCGNKCAAEAYRKRDPEAWRGVARKSYWKNPEKNRKAALGRYHANPPDRSEYSGFCYSSKLVPTARRVLGLTEKMSHKQKGRFSDWLLKVGHGTLKHHEVDHFVSDFNTQEI